ncbi:hypothetical protein ACH46N_06095 [Streptomyces pristinaespiralis]|uniref:Lipoprotein n=1 Tax=Streptomyces pristinaespiralis TaxID=38300 RepID=A0A0M4DMJ7_STRPR|nr:hypothetical protein [Streptomyces pristinaespiralis]ALC18845.1 lipoprotein [Streptomyces pristinaespiralis]QMU18019.1 hypothetical protein H3L99_34265 [Streptomyces pristinaespiralis]
MSGRWWGRAVAVAALIVTTSACGSLDERRDDVTAEVTGFEQALGAEQFARVCAALAPETLEELEQSARSSCEEAIGEEDLTEAGAVRRVDVYGDQARVVLDQDTLFLSHFPTGWKVTAAGCTPREGRPYQCELKGG